jgi:hypothetical protein
MKRAFTKLIKDIAQHLHQLDATYQFDEDWEKACEEWCKENVKTGQRIRHKNPNVRIVYDPEWSESKPFKTYRWGRTKGLTWSGFWDMEAGPIFATLSEAKDYLGCRYSRSWSEWS